MKNAVEEEEGIKFQASTSSLLRLNHLIVFSLRISIPV